MTNDLTAPIQYADIDLDTVYRLIAEAEAEDEKRGDGKRGDDEFWAGWSCALLDLRQRMGRADTDSKIAQLAAAGIICATCTGFLHHSGRCLDCERRAATPAAYLAAMGTIDADGRPVQTEEQEAICALYNRIETDVYGAPAREPNACGICGAPECGHCIRYGGGHVRLVDGGQYQAPTNRQRLDRMYARRAAATFSLWVEVNRPLMTATIQARTARKPHRCEDCRRPIPVGHRYLRHVKFPDGAAAEMSAPTVLNECVSCAGERDDTDPMLVAGACGSYCHGVTPCALPFRHGDDRHQCSNCPTA